MSNWLWYPVLSPAYMQEKKKKVGEKEYNK
jgi:hypothetical protein